MQRPIGSQALARLQLLGAAGVLVGALALWLAADRWGDRFYLIHPQEDAAWITIPQPEWRAKAIQVSRSDPPRYRFEKQAWLGTVPARVPVRIRGLRQLSLSVNDVPVPLPGREARHWKRAVEMDLAPWLRVGANRVTAELAHSEGPVLLQIRSDELRELATGPHGWRVTRVGYPRRIEAVVANDLRHYPLGDALPVPATVLRGRVWPLLLVFLLCGAPAWLGLRAPAVLGGTNLPRTAGVAVGLFWLALFASRGLTLPNLVGFDARGHVDYVERLTREHRIPRADEGWETFQPPLYYAAAASLRAWSGAAPDTPLDRGALRLLPMLAGLLSAVLAGRTARLLAPASPGLAALAIVAAGLLPMHLLLSVFVSNEVVHAGVVSAALWAACGLLCEARGSVRGMAALSLLLGLGLLTKSTTSLPIALLLPAAVGLKLWLIEARPASRALGACAAMLAGIALLSGWFYLRNAILFGDPFVTNLTAFSQWAYWIPPGFHTPAWFLGFGEVLSRPFFSSFASFADGFYSSFWGDGYGSGGASLRYPSVWWDYDSMAALYPLALPATGILALGFARGAWQALRGPDLGRRLALSVLWLVAFAMFLLVLLGTGRLPFNAMPKAFYALPALVPMAVAFALGAQWLHGLGRGASGRLLRGGLFGYGGVLAASILFAFLH